MNSPFAPGSRVVVYLRHSPGDQQSIDSQEHAVCQQCAALEIEIFRSYKDEARSGTTVAGRDAFLRMMNDLQGRDGIGGVVLWSLSRFGRDYDDADFYMATLRKRGYEIYSMTDDVPSGRIGRVFEAFHRWKAEEDSVRIGKDAQRGLRWLAEQGYSVGGFPPVGYRKSAPVEIGKRKNGTARLAHKWEIDPATEALVRTAWRMKLERHGNWDIHHALHLFKGVNCYSAFFTNKTYVGIRKCGELEIAGAHPAYVSADEFEQVQHERPPQRIKAAEYGSELHPARQKQNNAFLLSGIMRCGYCEHMMVGSGNSNDKWYRCGLKQRAGSEVCVQKAISAHHLHAMVAEYLQHEVFSFEQLMSWRDQIAELLDRSRSDLSAQKMALQKQRETLLRKIESIVDALEDHPSEELAARLSVRRNEVSAVQADIARVSDLLKNKSAVLTDIELRAVSDNFCELLKDADLSVARRAIQSVVVKANLYAERLVMTIEPPITASRTMPPRDSGSIVSATPTSHFARAPAVAETPAAPNP